jgi:hypothetical protein
MGREAGQAVAQHDRRARRVGILLLCDEATDGHLDAERVGAKDEILAMRASPPRGPHWRSWDELTRVHQPARAQSLEPRVLARAG